MNDNEIMKKRLKRDRTFKPSAVLLSIVIHAGLFLLAGMLVVFTVVKKQEQQFDPPKAVERPKMKLKKPRVRVKKSSRPKSTARITTTRADKSAMPSIDIPSLGGLGDGLGDGIGGFDLMPQLEEVSLFGSMQSIGSDLEGAFYDFKRDRNGRNIPYDIDSFLNTLKNFVRSGWNPSTLAKYYRSPRTLYATTIMVPPVFSILAPEAFGEHDTAGFLWVVHYQGQLVCPPSYPDGITFRFWGMGDDVMVVGVGGEVVLNACWPNAWRGYNFKTPALNWQSSSADSRKYYYGHQLAEVGDWITLEPGESQDLDIIIGETPGGHFVAMLSVEVQGETYEKGPQSNPILPIFKTAVPTRDLVETIHENLVPGEVCVTSGPVFCDFDSSGVNQAEWEQEPVEPLVLVDSVEPEMRNWSVGSKNFTARFVAEIGFNVVLEDTNGKQFKVPTAQVSDADRLYVETIQPPEFDIDFSRKSAVRFFQESRYITGARWLPKHLDYTFSVRLRQVSAGPYNHELMVEFFAIGEEIEGDNYILLDRQESRFTPGRENERSHSFSGDTVGLRESTIFSERRGRKYGGYLVLVTDSRGIIIDYGASHEWLLDIANILRHFPEGRHFDKSGARVEPPRPKSIGRY